MRGDDAQALVLRALDAARPVGEAYPHVHARIAQRERVGVALAAVPEDGDVAPLDKAQVGAVVINDLCHFPVLFLSRDFLKTTPADVTPGW